MLSANETILDLLVPDDVSDRWLVAADLTIAEVAVHIAIALAVVKVA
jgi:hypothetical protein